MNYGMSIQLKFKKLNNICIILLSKYEIKKKFEKKC